MKTTIFIIALLLLSSIAIAVPEPELLLTKDVSGDIVNATFSSRQYRIDGYGEIAYPGNNVVMLTKYNNTGTKVLFYQLSTGTLLFEDEGITGGQRAFISAGENWAVACYSTGFNQYNPRFRFYDVTNPAFITIKPIVGYTVNSNAEYPCAMLDVQGAEITMYSSYGNRLFIYNHQNETITHNENIVGDTPSGRNVSVVDMDNKVFGIDDKLYSWDDTDLGNLTEIFDLGTGKGNFYMFDGNSNSPRFLTSENHLVIVDDSTYSSISATGVQINNFKPFIIAGEQQIYGEINDNGYISGVNFTDYINPVGEIFNTALVGDGLVPAAGFRPPSQPSGLFATYDFSISVPTIQFWSFQQITGVDTDNNAPTLSASFLGTDSQQNNFVFAVQIRDVDGGAVYRALDVSLPAVFNLEGTTIHNDIDFDEYSDLNYVTALLCTNEFYNLTFSTGTPQFDIDGSLYYNTTGACNGPLIIDIDDVYAAQNNEVTVETSFFFELDGFSHPIVRNYEIQDKDGIYILSLTFNQTSASTAQVFNYDGFNDTLLATATSFFEGTSFWFVRAELDFTTQTADVEIRNGFGGAIIYTGTLPFLNSVNNVGKVTFGSWSIEDADFYIDNVDAAYQSAGDTPTWLFHANLEPGETRIRDARATIPGGFGLYEANIFATDDIVGFDNYSIQDILLVEYDENTPILTEAEISQIINDLNSGGTVFEEGDFITDTLQSFLDSIGLMTAYSKAFAGFLILLLVVGFMSGYPAEMQVLVTTIGFLLLTIWGFFPSWLLVIIIIICVALVGMAARRVIAGNN
jgi:hypothetical protein